LTVLESARRLLRIDPANPSLVFDVSCPFVHRCARRHEPRSAPSSEQGFVGIFQSIQKPRAFVLRASSYVTVIFTYQRQVGSRHGGGWFGRSSYDCFRCWLADRARTTSCCSLSNSRLARGRAMAENTSSPGSSRGESESCRTKSGSGAQCLGPDRIRHSRSHMGRCEPTDGYLNPDQEGPGDDQKSRSQRRQKTDLDPGSGLRPRCKEHPASTARPRVR
jgi:hypothetical protein